MSAKSKIHSWSRTQGPRAKYDILDFILKEGRGGGPGAEKSRNLVLGGLAQCVVWLLSSEEEWSTTVCMLLNTCLEIRAIGPCETKFFMFWLRPPTVSPLSGCQ